MEGLTEKIAKDVAKVMTSLEELLDLLPYLPSKASRDDRSTGQAPSQNASQKVGSSSRNCKLALVTMNGYALDPENAQHRRSRVVMKASKGGQVFALKFLGKATSELQILHSLLSPSPELHHVIELIDVISSKFYDVIVMPWLFPLDVALDERPETIPSLQTQFLKGVSHLHQHNVAHIDLKPGNVLINLSSSPHLSIIDFGLSMRVCDEQTEAEGYCRTLTWSAPEVETEYGPRMRYCVILADRWSCGKVLEYMAKASAGCHPLVASSEFDHAWNQLLDLDPRKRPLLDKVLQLQSRQANSMAKRGSDNTEAEAGYPVPERACTVLGPSWYVCIFFVVCLAQAMGPYTA